MVLALAGTTIILWLVRRSGLRRCAAALLVLVLTAASGLGQGQFVFNNRVLPEINARFVLITDDPSGAVSSVGIDYTVLLFASEAGKNTYVALDPPSTSFRGPAGSPAAGYVTPTTETVPGIGPGSTVNISVRVAGPIPGCGGFAVQQFGPYTVSLGGGTITPPNVPMGASPLVVGCVPECSAKTLALVGVLALLLPHAARASTRRWIERLG